LSIEALEERSLLSLGLNGLADLGAVDLRAHPVTTHASPGASQRSPAASTLPAKQKEWDAGGVVAPAGDHFTAHNKGGPETPPPGPPDGTSSNFLFFYEYGAGFAATGYLAQDGSFHELWESGGFNPYWTNIVSDSSGHLFFYEYGAGFAATGYLAYDGSFSELWESGGFNPDWYIIA
jgi:hypothetical protein